MSSKSLSRQWLLTVTLLLLIGSITALNIISGYNTINTTAQERLVNDTRIIDVNLSRQIVAVDLALVSIRKDLPMLKSENNSKTLINTRLKAMSDTMAGVRTLFVFDAGATVTHSNREELVGLNFRDRPYYINAQQNPNPDILYISAPYTTVLGAFAITMVKVISDEQGGFAGLVGATIDPQYFATVLGSVLEEPYMWASLTHEDGKLFMVIPTPVVADGADVARVNSFYTRQIDNGQPNILTTENNPDTGKGYMIAESIIKPTGILVDKGFVVAVGHDMSTIFADWRRNALILGSLFGLMVLATSLGMFINQKRQRIYYRLMASQDTERKQAAAKLNESETRLRLANKAAGFGVYEYKYATNEAYYSPDFMAIYGLSPDTALELDDDLVPRAIHPDDKAHFLAATKQANDPNGGGVLNIEYRIIRHDGQVRWLHVQGKTTFSNNSPSLPTIAHGFIQDITDRKLAEQTLRKSEEKYRTLVDKAQAGIVVHGADAKILTCNPMAEELLGLTKDQLMGITAIDPTWHFFHEDFTPMNIKEYPVNRVIETRKAIRGLFFGIHRPVTNDDRWVLVNADPVFDSEGKIVEVIVFSVDITERKKAEEALKLSEERHSTILQTALDGFWVVDKQGRLLEVNDAYSRMSGYTREELLSMHIPDLEAAETGDNTASHIQKTMEQGFDRFESQHRRKDGSVFFLLISVQYRPTDGGRLVAFLQDITERKVSEAEALKLREKAEVSSRLAAVGEMAAGIAHEINNPLTGVIGFSELLMEKKDVPDDIKDELKIINDGSQRVKEIVKRMLTFARQAKPVKTSASINELIDATLGLRAYVLRTANIEVVKYFSTDLPWIVVDPGQMQQVFLNIIVNAEYAMKKAHGKGTLTITTERIGDHIHILFKDDGMGMDNETREKIFNPFFTTKQVGEGTGLGLSLSHSIVLEHGGTVTVESEPGQGATFIITLPITSAPEEAASIKADAAPVHPRVKAARILVVDDEESIRKLVSTLLSSSGHTVETTSDAREALLKMDSVSYDAVLVDIRMPQMSGMELYDNIKPRRPELAGRFLFITGDTSDSNTRDFLEKNGLSFITKPFDKETLFEKVNGLL